MVAYLKPPGYKTVFDGYGLYTSSPTAMYKPFNNFVSGSMKYSPQGLPGYLSYTLNFSAAPADGSQLILANSPGESPVTFTFTYNGAPGAGVIPLVAGGGTAAQAATATQVALAAQLLKWVATNPSAGLVGLTYSARGIYLPLTTVGVVNFTTITTLPSFGAVLPARFGKNYAVMSGTPVDVPEES